MSSLPAPEDVVERAMVTIRQRQQRRVIAETARRHGISTSDIALTEVLDAVDDDNTADRIATVTGIASRLRMDQPRVSRLVRGAIADGLLTRSADRHDGRSSRLLLTAAGRARLDETRRRRRTIFAGAMADWSDDERETFANLLTRFVADLAK
jgi:DNA-binding MarR family transcriptional regulator